MKRVLAILLSVGLLATSAAAASAETWGQWRYDAAHSGINDAQVPITKNDALHWRVRWSKKPDEHKTYLTQAIVTDTSVIVGGTKIGKDGMPHAQIWSYRPTDGAQQWVRQLPCGRVQPPAMALSDGVLLATVVDCPDPDGWQDRIAFVNATTGAKIKILPMNASVSTPTIADGMAIYDNFSESQVEFIDLATMTHTKTVVYGESSFSSSGGNEPLPVMSDGLVWLNNQDTAPAVGEGVAIIYAYAYGFDMDQPAGAAQFLKGGDCTADGDALNICAVDLSTGQILWQKPEQTTGTTFTTQYGRHWLIRDGKAYAICGGPAGQWGMCQVDLRTGNFLHGGMGPRPTLGWPSTPASRPVFGGGLVFGSGYDNHSRQPGMTVFAYDPGRVGIPELEMVMVRYGHGLIEYGARSETYVAVANTRVVTTSPGIKVITFDAPCCDEPPPCRPFTCRQARPPRDSV